ncbi:MAG: M56 family metallopeptidase [Peptococcaceae bacterium]|nr:M56 family metallopeptidase [Peptococcaceae bacterium]
MPELVKIIFAKMFTVSLIAGVLTALIVAAAAWMNRRYSPRWRYWVWLFFAIWLVIPVTLPVSKAPLAFSVPDIVVIGTSPTASQDIIGQSGGGSSELWTQSQRSRTATDPAADPSADPSAALVSTPATTPAADPATGAAAASPDSLSGLTLMDLLVMVWLLGVVAFLLVGGIKALWFRVSLRRMWRPCGSAEVARSVRRTMEEMAFYPDMRIMICQGIRSPFVTGLIRPALVLPGETYDPCLLGHVIHHEMTHCRRRDLWYKLIINLANAVHWFNPLVWVMNRAGDRDLELVCDELVTRGQDRTRRREYSESILLTLKPGKTRRLPGLTTSFSAGAKDLKRRFENIVLTPAKRSGSLFLMLTMLLAVVVGSAAQVTVGSVEAGKETYLSGSEAGQGAYADPCGDIEKWERFPEETNWRIEDGKLVHDPSGVSSWDYAHLRDTEVVNGTVSAKVTIERRSDADIPWAGLTVRREANTGKWNSGYTVFVGWSDKNKSLILNIAKGIRSGHGGDGFTDRSDLKNLIIPGSELGKEVEITVVMRGSRIDVHVNAAWIAGFNDDDFIAGCVGPLAQDARISFSDFRVCDFDNIIVYPDPCEDIEKWERFPTNHNNWRSENGKLVRDPEGKTGYQYAYLRNTEVTDGVVSARITIQRLSGTDIPWAGLAVRQKTSGNQYNTGYVVYVGWSDRTNSLIINVAKGIPSGHGGDGLADRKDLKNLLISGSEIGKEVEIVIVMKGNRFNVYADGVWITGFNDDDFISGHVGPFAQDAEISFKEFKVYQF